ncbi:D-alanyl-D-alanine carboxypeptidase [Flavobacteriaceae bacterium]|nr:D-alanyl-D-alanine carboxypeptidase [Flavobacteriaceae bacterium]
MKRYLCVFYLLFWFSFLHAQKRLERQLNRSIAKEAVFQGAQVSVSVFDLEQKKEVVSLQSDKKILPASTIKLVPFLGALQTFGFSLPTLHYKKQDGRFYFWSSGYPLLGHPSRANDDVLTFLKKQKDSLFYIPRPMTSPALGSGWAWDDVSYAFSAKKSNFPFHGNLVQISSSPESDRLRFSPPGFEQRIPYTKKQESYELLVDDEIHRLSRVKADTLSLPFTPSDSLFVQLVQDAIATPIYRRSKQDVSLEGYKTLTTTKTLLYKALLHDSDNLVAESLVLMLCGTTQWELNTQQGLEALYKQNNTLKPQFQQVDGSGLSRYNLASPKGLLEILGTIHEMIGLRNIKTLFPQANSEGTLTPYAPQHNLEFVYAKSGNLRNNHALAGYIFTDTKKPFSFVISVNNYTGDKKAIQAAIGLQLSFLHKKLR